MQLTLFPECDEVDSNKKFDEMLDKYERLRKSQHARITGLQKKINDLESKLSFLESHICKGLLL